MITEVVVFTTAMVLTSLRESLGRPYSLLEESIAGPRGFMAAVSIGATRVARDSFRSFREPATGIATQQSGMDGTWIEVRRG